MEVFHIKKYIKERFEPLFFYHEDIVGKEMDMKGQTPITTLKGIGEKTAKLFHKLHIDTVEELVTYYPRSYDVFEPCVPLGEVTGGQICAVRGVVAGNPSVKKVRNLTILTVLVKDETGTMQMTFFNMPYLRSVLKPGGYYIFRGMVEKKGNLSVMEQPKLYKKEEYDTLCGTMQPIYPLTAGLTNQTVKKAMRQAIDISASNVEYIPDSILKEYELAGYAEAIENIHFPKMYDDMLQARNRLVFDEFFTFMLQLWMAKEYNKQQENRFPMVESADTLRLTEALPYELTGAQKRVWEEIKADLSGCYSMNRLIQGDVGSGKTIIAILALLQAVSNGYQGVLMAPTEVLAEQHFEAVTELTEQYHLPFKPVLLTGSVSAKDKKIIYERIASGECNLMIGTHALFQEKVTYKNLALVITDEQHRFGVRQREALAGKGEDVHVLVMSATPIPRTLATILYGDLDISVIDELPANRLPIKNCVVGTGYRSKAYEFIAKEVHAGRQAYVICPMVEQGEMDGLENVVDYCEKLKDALPADIQVAYLHGQMKPEQKHNIMEAFANHDIDVLVSTTVIEVGINVPNATVMMVENAERFGLAGLHQLRGRVGRGKYQSYCIFINTSENKHTTERLEILNKSNDGFYIAGEDLKLRGPGDLFGIRQSGIMNFKIGDIYHDASVLQNAKEAADMIWNQDAYLRKSENAKLYTHLQQLMREEKNFGII